MPKNREPEHTLLSRSVISLDTVSDKLVPLSRKNYSAILRSLGDVGQVHVADVLEIHEATISRMKNPGCEWERVAVLLASLNIELPDSDQRIYKVEVVEALRTLAKANLHRNDA